MTEPRAGSLRRVLGLPSLVLFGLGTMVGGGFYALLGEIVALSGIMAPVALGVAGLLALVNGLSFAAMSARFPVSAGEARYVGEGLGRPGLARLTGWLVIATGVVSAAALAVASAGFLSDLTGLRQGVGTLVVTGLLGVVAARGVGLSVGAVVAITVIEVGTLVVVFALRAEHLADLPAAWSNRPTGEHAVSLADVFSASFLAFYAFVGFEDMVNMAEEVRRPRRVLPRAIVLSVLITLALYVTVSLVATTGVDPERLARSRTPIAELVGGRGTVVVGVVSLLTGLNGALVQLMMASRVAYGLARSGHAPAWMGRVARRTSTPLPATAATTGVILALALTLPLASLARATSVVILVVFALVDLSLWRLLGRAPDPGTDVGAPRVPRWVPALGLAACLFALAFQAWVTVS